MSFIAENVPPNYDVRQVDAPLYRVDFWEKTNLGGWNLDTWLLKECESVFEAIAWAQTNSHFRSTRLMVSTSETSESGEMSVLFGEDPTASTEGAEVIFRNDSI